MKDLNTNQAISLLNDILEYELAGDYLAMAAYLAEIKSRILLPREEDNEEVEEDPKAELFFSLTFIFKS